MLASRLVATLTQRVIGGPSISASGSDTLLMHDESLFSTLADDTLTRLFDALEEVPEAAFDVDLQEGILTIEMENGGEYVINKNASVRQIWVSSPVSGAHHFDHDEDSGVWRTTRADGQGKKVTLGALLSRELSVAGAGALPNV